MKVCSRCGVEKEDGTFRVRFDRRLNLRYLNNTCRECDKIKAKEYYERIKNEPAFKEKNKKRVQAYAKANKERISKKNKAKRATSEYKAYRKKYIESHKARIYKQNQKRNKIYNARLRAEIADQYAIVQLTHPRNGLSREEVRQNPELIKKKKVSIAKDRIKKIIKKIDNEK